MIHTSYFAKSAKNPNAVSIAGKAPDWYKGREFKILAPKYWFFKKYKEDGDKEFYSIQYSKEILDKLDPIEIYNTLGENAVLLCWEKPGEFCHRHLVAEWLTYHLDISVTEL